MLVQVRAFYATGFDGLSTVVCSRDRLFNDGEACKLTHMLKAGVPAPIGVWQGPVFCRRRLESNTGIPGSRGSVPAIIVKQFVKAVEKINPCSIVP